MIELVGAAKLDAPARWGDFGLKPVPFFLLSDFFCFGTLILLKMVAASGVGRSNVAVILL